MTTIPSPSARRPTHIRYVIVGVAMLAALLLYLERVCVGVAEVYIREDLHIGKMEMDFAFGAFFIAYALGQVPSGWLRQRYGPRRMMGLYMLGWSIFGVFIALAQNFWMLFAARFLLGLSQAGAYPTAALLVKRWVPDCHRGVASSVVAFGGRAGGAGANWLTGVLIVAFVPITVPATLTPDAVLSTEEFSKKLHNEKVPKPLLPVVSAVRAHIHDPNASLTDLECAEAVNAVVRTPSAFVGLDWKEIALAVDGKDILAKPPGERTEQESKRLNRLVIEKAFPGAIRQLHTDGWRPTLMVYGMLGIVVGGIFWVVVRNWPWEHPWANAAEVALIKEGQSPVGEHRQSNAIPFKQLMDSRNQWYFSAANFFSNVGWVFLITLMPRFLDERFSTPVTERGLMTTIPIFAAAFTMLFGGWATDWATAKWGRRWGRAGPMGLTKFPCALAMLSCIWLPDAWSVTIALTLMSMLQDFGVPAMWAFAQDTGGKQVAAVLGWANMWGNFGAGIAPPIFGLLAKHGGWDASFIFGASAFVLCGISATLINAEQPLFPDRVPDEPDTAVE